MLLVEKKHEETQKSNLLRGFTIQAVNVTCTISWWLSDDVRSVSLRSAILLSVRWFSSIYQRQQAGCWSEKGGGAWRVPPPSTRGRHDTRSRRSLKKVNKCVLRRRRLSYSLWGHLFALFAWLFTIWLWNKLYLITFILTFICTASHILIIFTDYYCKLWLLFEFLCDEWTTVRLCFIHNTKFGHKPDCMQHSLSMKRHFFRLDKKA